MVSDGVGADIHAGGDLVVVESLGDEAGDGLLGAGQALPPGDRPGGGRAPVAAADAELAQPPPDAGLVTVGGSPEPTDLKRSPATADTATAAVLLASDSARLVTRNRGWSFRPARQAQQGVWRDPPQADLVQRRTAGWASDRW
jgi:hypothetical protein